MPPVELVVSDTMGGEKRVRVEDGQFSKQKVAAVDTRWGVAAATGERSDFGGREVTLSTRFPFDDHWHIYERRERDKILGDPKRTMEIQGPDDGLVVISARYVENLE